MMYRPRIFGRSRNPAGSLPTGAIYKAPTAPEKVAEEKPEHHRRREEPSEPEITAEEKEG
jgi:hypothetical protein